MFLQAVVDLYLQEPQIWKQVKRSSWNSCRIIIYDTSKEGKANEQIDASHIDMEFFLHNSAQGGKV